MKAKRAKVRRVAGKFRSFHWGEEPQNKQKGRAPKVSAGEVLYELGELVEIVYETSKGGEIYEWIHKFEEPRPRLASTESGGLVIVGGGYSVEARGIVR